MNDDNEVEMIDQNNSHRRVGVAAAAVAAAAAAVTQEPPQPQPQPQKQKQRRGRGRELAGGADDIILAAHHHEDDCAVVFNDHDDQNQNDYNYDYAPVVRRQNTCFTLSFVSCLIAMTVLLVGKVYMAPPTEIETVIGELHGGISGSMETKTVEDSPTTDSSNPNPTGSILSKTHAKENDVAEWIKNKGKLPSTYNPKNPIYNGQSMNGLFDHKKWILAHVSLKDGAMFEVIKQLQHDSGAFTQGLAFARGQLYESTGIKGQSTIRKLNPSTGEVIESIPLSKTYFGEGLAIVRGKAVQLTWKSKTGFIYDLRDLSKTPFNFTFSSTRDEGWGLAYSPYLDELAMSDGSDYIHFWNPRNLSETRRIQVVRQNGANSTNINELEFFHGRILANIWYQDVIISIDPFTGTVDKEYDFSSLFPRSERRKVKAGVLNGISKAAKDDLLYITGKNWDRMFLVRLQF